MTLAKSGCAGKKMVVVVDVEVAFEVEELVPEIVVTCVAEETGERGLETEVMVGANALRAEISDD